MVARVPTPVRILAAGAVAGLGFAAFSILLYGSGGRGVWRPVNLVAHLVWRDAPIGGRFSAAATAYGLLLLVGVGILMITPYAALVAVSDLSPAPVIVAGAVIYTNAVWIIGDYIVWPKLDATAALRFSGGVAWTGHMVAGGLAGVVLVARPGMVRASAYRQRLAELARGAGRRA
jgi:hypothetical protein